jgi:hypothetical protein
MTVPTSRFSGVLKQVNVPALSPENRGALQSAFPDFLHESKRTDFLAARGIRWEMTAYQPRPAGWGRLRRYAGSADFGPGRYWSVCLDEHGFDGKTLLNELMTYWTPKTMTYPTITDLTLVAPDQRKLPDPLLLLTISSYSSGNGTQAVEKVGSAFFELPLTVCVVDIADVIDLRIPEVRSWFFEHFTELEESIGMRGHTGEPVVWKTYKYHKPANFNGLLPTLVVSGIGGSAFHQAVGAWLRSHGVAGLVYPSARCDAYVCERTIGGERFAEFYGWTFVDYRNAGPAEWEPLFGRLSTWVLPDRIAITVERCEEGTGFRIHGAEEGERGRVRSMREVMLGQAESPLDWDPYSGYRRPRLK